MQQLGGTRQNGHQMEIWERVWGWPHREVLQVLKAEGLSSKADWPLLGGETSQHQIYAQKCWRGQGLKIISAQIWFEADVIPVPWIQILKIGYYSLSGGSNQHCDTYSQSYTSDDNFISKFNSWMSCPGLADVLQNITKLFKAFKTFSYLQRKH